MKQRLVKILTLVVSISLSPLIIGAEKDSAFVPFYFSTETLGSTVGVAGVAKGIGQPQAALFGMGLYSEKDSYIGFLSAFNYALSDQLLVSTQMYQARFNDSPYYISDQGDNDSTVGDYTITNGFEESYELEFKYLLPWGTIAQHGLLGAFKPIKDVDFASPLESGISSISFSPFYSTRELDIDGDKQVATGFELSLDWDNRDSVRNPTKGSHTSLDLTFGAENWSRDDAWSKWEFQNSHYYPLGELGDWFDQQVVAFDFYTADTPSWSEHKPPEHQQVRLGGLYRLRSYTGGRFHGRSAVHYSAEYRVIPDWQPLEEVPLINYYDLPWWQWVLFVEAGRVAEQYDLSELHSDMRWNIGGAVRFQVEGIVVRLESAKGAEESTFRVMINQPF